MEVAYPVWINLISPWLSLGFLELRIKALKSLTSGENLGWGYIPMTLKATEQTRSSSQAFLQDALTKGSQLVIYKSTMAMKINFNGTLTAGITASTGGVSYNITARKEVISSAGVVSSNVILLSLY